MQFITLVKNQQYFVAIICEFDLDELVIGFTGERYQDTPPLVVKVIMDLFNAKKLNVSSAKEVATFFNITLKITSPPQ